VRKAERVVLVGIVIAVAVALRWGFVATAHVPNPLRADAGQYAQCAHNLVEHGVYSLSTEVPPPPDSFRSPGYPLFLAACKVAGGEAHWMKWVMALQVVFGGLTVLLCYRVARAFLSFAPSLAASTLCALSPHLVVSGAYVLTECVTTFVLALGLWGLGATPERSALRRTLAALVLGCAVLCNETLVFVPLVAGCTLLRVIGWKRTIAFLFVALLPLGAWTVRNQSQPLVRTGSERMVASISHGSYPGMVLHDPRLVGFPYHEDPEQPAFGSSWSNLFDVLARRAAAEPWRYATWYLLEKPLWLWRWHLVQGNGALVYDVSNSPYDRQPVMVGSQSLMRWLHVPVMLLAAVGALVLAWNPRRRFGFLPQLLGLCAVFGTLAYLPVIPDPRYLQPLRPFLFVLACGAVAAAVGFVQGRRGCSRDASSSAENGGQIFQLGLPTSSRTAPPSS